jgi:hypothetical protein
VCVTLQQVPAWVVDDVSQGTVSACFQGSPACTISEGESAVCDCWCVD